MLLIVTSPQNLDSVIFAKNISAQITEPLKKKWKYTFGPVFKDVCLQLK